MSGDPIMEPLTITLETTDKLSSLPSLPVVLKKIMETPPPNILEVDEDTDKEKLYLGDDVDLGGGVSGLGPSAALTPAIWDKTIPYNGETFHLEYMDLEEFLIENGISTSLEGTADKEGSVDSNPEDKASAMGRPKPKVAPAPGESVSLVPTLQLDSCEEEVVTSSEEEVGTSSDTTDKDRNRDTPEPIDPEEIEVDVNFEPDPTDLVLSSVPGGELFNPRKHKFSDEDLKPQPMIKKAKKVFVPEERKDDKYWERRKKNNVAAKRSRDARRLKENQITVRAAFLERENTALRQEVAELRKDFGRCKKVLSCYEDKFGTLAPLGED